MLSQGKGHNRAIQCTHWEATAHMGEPHHGDSQYLLGGPEEMLLLHSVLAVVWDYTQHFVIVPWELCFTQSFNGGVSHGAGCSPDLQALFPCRHPKYQNPVSTAFLCCLFGGHSWWWSQQCSKGGARDHNQAPFVLPGTWLPRGPWL